MGAIQTLIVCEKPDAAARVARALDDDGDPRLTEMQGVPVHEARHRKDTITVCSALGHLYAVDSKGRASRRYHPIWDCAWKPKYIVDKKSARLARWIHVISSLAKQADHFVNACDYDTEGSLIGYTILRYACDDAHKKAQRMKFSTMTEQELQTAYRTLSQHLDYSQIEAGRCRHELDWLYGINLTRLLTESALKLNRGYSTLSTGRVQGPTLRSVVDREEEIRCFTPTPFWTIEATILHNGHVYPLEYEKEKIPVAADAEKVVSDCKGSILEVTGKESYPLQQPPPHPFDLSSLQSEAYRHFGYTPARTLALAERLYLEALISYPRTSSQQLPPDIGYAEILRAIATRDQYKRLASRLANQPLLRPTQGSKQDPAHPAIYPTGESPKRRLAPTEANLLDLIIRGFMATFAESSLRENTKISITHSQYRFFLQGSTILRDGWTEYYRPYTSDDSQQPPNLKVGDQLPLKSIEAAEKFTEPPLRYNPSSLLRKMEDENIGTKATRAEIIDILYGRGYIKDIRIQATPLAVKIISILDKYCPLIIDSSFTAQLENQMENIRADKTTRLEVLIQTVESLRPIMLDLIGKEEELGKQLAELVASQRMSALTFDYPCPACNSKLMIVRSRVSRKRFIGCTGYEKGCRFSLPLPQFGSLTIIQKSCKICGFQLVKTWTKRRQPMISCARCYSNGTKEDRARSKTGRSPTDKPSSPNLLETPPLVENQ